MAPFIVLTGSFLVLLLLRATGLWPSLNWVGALRIALALMFLLTASAHFGSRRAELVAMVPPALGAPGFWVTFTGIAEIAGALGLLVPRLAPYAAGGLALMLLAMLPANVHAALNGLTLGGKPVTPLVPRVLLQAYFLVAVLLAGFWRR